MENTSETTTKTVETAPETAVSSSASASAENTEATPTTANDAPQSKSGHFFVTTEMKNDPVSKKMFLYSKIFAVLSLTFIGILTYQQLKRKNFYRKPPAKHEVVASEDGFTYQLGLIHVVLKNEQDLRVDLSLECTNKPTCEYIKENPEKARDAILPLLSNIDPGSISSTESKSMIRNKLTEALNTLDMNGKVIQVNFTDLTLEGKGQ